MSLNGAPAESFAPVDFTELRFPSSGAPDWQRVASLASAALVDVLRRAGNAIDFLESIYDGDLDSGQAVVACEQIPGTPPSGVGQEGELVATDLGADDYRIATMDCFARAAGQPVGFVTTGSIDLRSLVTTERQNTIVRVGFEGSAQSNGGVTYDLRERMIQETSPMTWTFIGAENRLTGGYSIVLSEP